MAMPTSSCLRSCSTLSLQHQNLLFLMNSNRKSFRFSSKIRTQLTPLRKRFIHVCPLQSASINGYSIENVNQKEVFNGKNVKLWNHLRRLIDILPGGNWWRLSTDQVDITPTAEPVSILIALMRIWDLIFEDRRVVYAAFAALLFSSLSEICIPHFLTASIFSAQSSNISKFHQNVSLLVLLCVVSGISRSRSCTVKAPFFF